MVLIVCPLIFALAVGCGGAGERGPGEASAKRATDADSNRKPDDLVRTKREREEDRGRKENQEFDRAFNETPFERLLSELPLREPPLYVRQLLMFDGSHTVHTRVARHRFLCDTTPSDRRAAVAAYYREADQSFRRNGIDDFVQIVSPLTQTAETLPALAVARPGWVILTRVGRARNPC